MELHVTNLAARFLTYFFFFFEKSKPPGTQTELLFSSTVRTNPLLAASSISYALESQGPASFSADVANVYSTKSRLRSPHQII